MSLLITCEVGGETIPEWLPRAINVESPAPASGVSSHGQSFATGDRIAGDGLFLATDGLVTQATKPLTATFDQRADQRHDRWSRLFARTDRAGKYAAERMSARLGAPLIVNEHPIDLIDVTRPLHHRQLFSKLTRTLAPNDRDKLIAEVYETYLQRVRATIDSMIRKNGFLIHLAVSSFNLKARGKIRRTDVGLLYDPSRDDERDLCLDWIDEMWERAPMLRVRRNYPRRGTTAGLTRSFRREFAAEEYQGMEVWLNRAWARRNVAMRDEALDGIADSLRVILETETNDTAQAA
jgi:predicted N-formylglutamate amidohydrolase